MEINEIEYRKAIEKLNKIKIFFLKINKIDKPLPRLTKERKEYSTKIRNESGDITTNLIRITRILREYYEQLYTNKLIN